MSYAAYKTRLESSLDSLMDKEPTPARVEGVALLLDVLDRLDDRLDAMPHADSAAELDAAGMHRWVDGMTNADGTRGAHWTEADTTNVGRSIGVDFDKISPLCWWAALNMMRSDYYPTAAKFGLDRPDFYAALAHDFLLDPDAPGPEKKLKGYYYGVVEG